MIWVSETHFTVECFPARCLVSPSSRRDDGLARVRNILTWVLQSESRGEKNGWHYTTGLPGESFYKLGAIKTLYLPDTRHTSKFNLQYSSWHHSLFDTTTIEALIEDGKFSNLISASGQVGGTAALYLALMSVKLLFSPVRAHWLAVVGCWQKFENYISQ